MTALHHPAGGAPSLAAALHMAALEADADFDTCAALMATSDPWLRLGLDLQTCRRVVRQAERETWGAWQGSRLAGFVVLNFKGPFVGYVQLLGVAADLRGQGVGAALLAHAEECIFARTPNVFICVSSFNTSAQRFYARLGYQSCGRLDNYLVAGHDELLLRKTRGPLLKG
jgi:ribosomal-protein-alanine N-acetyltransferase